MGTGQQALCLAQQFNRGGDEWWVEFEAPFVERKEKHVVMAFCQSEPHVGSREPWEKWVEDSTCLFGLNRTFTAFLSFFPDKILHRNTDENEDKGASRLHGYTAICISHIMDTNRAQDMKKPTQPPAFPRWRPIMDPSAIYIQPMTLGYYGKNLTKLPLQDHRMERNIRNRLRRPLMKKHIHLANGGIGTKCWLTLTPDILNIYILAIRWVSWLISLIKIFVHLDS